MSAISLWYSEVLNQIMFYISSGVLKFEIVCIKFQPIQMVTDSAKKQNGFFWLLERILNQR